MNYLTTQEVAQKLNYKSVARVRTLISERKVDAKKFGGVWMIPVEELGKFERTRKQYKKRKTS